METHDFWTNLFAAYRASPDLIKVLWLAIPPGFLLALLFAILHHHNRRRPALKLHGSTLAFTVIRQDDGTLQIYRHDGCKVDARPFVLSLSEDNGPKTLDYNGDAGWR